jgi:hypothetical protein
MAKLVNSKPKKRHASQFGQLQQCLLDASGYVPLNVKNDVRVLRGSNGRYTLAGMSFELSPTPKDLDAAFEIVADAMRLLHIERNRWKYLKPGCIEQLQLDIWKCASCVVSFRRQIDDGTIRAAYAQGRLELSIPHPELWRHCGLSWLAHYTYCCARNIENPTPWLGPSCGCEKRKLLSALSEARRRAVARSITTNTHTFCSHD